MQAGVLYEEDTGRARPQFTSSTLVGLRRRAISLSGQRSLTRLHRSAIGTKGGVFVHSNLTATMCFCTKYFVFLVLCHGMWHVLPCVAICQHVCVRYSQRESRHPRVLIAPPPPTSCCIRSLDVLTNFNAAPGYGKASSDSSSNRVAGISPIWGQLQGASARENPWSPSKSIRLRLRPPSQQQCQRNGWKRGSKGYGTW